MLATDWAQLVGNLLDGALALGQHVDDLSAAPTAQRLGHLGERIEQCVLRLAVGHAAMLRSPPTR